MKCQLCVLCKRNVFVYVEYIIGDDTVICSTVLTITIEISCGVLHLQEKSSFNYLISI